MSATQNETSEQQQLDACRKALSILLQEQTDVFVASTESLAHPLSIVALAAAGYRRCLIVNTDARGFWYMRITDWDNPKVNMLIIHESSKFEDEYLVQINPQEMTVDTGVSVSFHKQEADSLAGGAVQQALRFLTIAASKFLSRSEPVTDTEFQALLERYQRQHGGSLTSVRTSFLVLGTGITSRNFEGRFLRRFALRYDDMAKSLFLQYLVVLFSACDETVKRELIAAAKRHDVSQLSQKFQLPFSLPDEFWQVIASPLFVELLSAYCGASKPVKSVNTSRLSDALQHKDEEAQCYILNRVGRSSKEMHLSVIDNPFLLVHYLLQLTQGAQDAFLRAASFHRFVYLPILALMPNAMRESQLKRRCFAHSVSELKRVINLLSTDEADVLLATLADVAKDEAQKIQLMYLMSVDACMAYSLLHDNITFDVYEVLGSKVLLNVFMRNSLNVNVKTFNQAIRILARSTPEQVRASAALVKNKKQDSKQGLARLIEQCFDKDNGWVIKSWQLCELFRYLGTDFYDELLATYPNLKLSAREITALSRTRLDKYTQQCLAVRFSDEPPKSETESNSWLFDM